MEASWIAIETENVVSGKAFFFRRLWRKKNSRESGTKVAREEKWVKPLVFCCHFHFQYLFSFYDYCCFVHSRNDPLDQSAEATDSHTKNSQRASEKLQRGGSTKS